MSKRIEVSILINKPLDVVWNEVKVMEDHVKWMEDAVKIDILSDNTSGSVSYTHLTLPTIYSV